MGQHARDRAPYIDPSVWMSVFPGAAIMIVVLGFNFLGDGLRDILDPRLGGGVGRREVASTMLADLLSATAGSSTAPAPAVPRRRRDRGRPLVEVGASRRRSRRRA